MKVILIVAAVGLFLTLGLMTWAAVSIVQASLETVSTEITKVADSKIATSFAEQVRQPECVAFLLSTLEPKTWFAKAPIDNFNTMKNACFADNKYLNDKHLKDEEMTL